MCVQKMHQFYLMSIFLAPFKTDKKQVPVSLLLQYQNKTANYEVRALVPFVGIKLTCQILEQFHFSPFKFKSLIDAQKYKSTLHTLSCNTEKENLKFTIPLLFTCIRLPFIPCTALRCCQHCEIPHFGTNKGHYLNLTITVMYFVIYT